jgi:hypothetical protein
MSEEQPVDIDSNIGVPHIWYLTDDTDNIEDAMIFGYTLPGFYFNDARQVAPRLTGPFKCVREAWDAMLDAPWHHMQEVNHES